MPLVQHTKYTMIFEYTSGDGDSQSRDRPGSASESVLGADNSINKDAFNGLMLARAALLPFRCRIVGQRYQRIDPSGASRSDDKIVVGGDKTIPQDVPQMALQCRTISVLGENVRKFFIHMVPDDYVRFGEFRGPQFYKDALQVYFNALSGWYFRALDLQQPRQTIVRVNPDGTYQTVNPLAVAAGDFVQILRGTTTTGASFHGRFRVLTTAGVNGSLESWPNTVTLRSGTMRRWDIVYRLHDYNTTKVVRGGLRKVGRPAEPYRGRATRAG